MALNTLKCNNLTPVRFNGLSGLLLLYCRSFSQLVQTSK